MEAPPTDCWLHPAVEVRPSPLSGRGLFATETIAEGEAVLRFGGSVVSDDELAILLSRRVADPSHPYVDAIMIGEDRHLVLPPGQPHHFGNHSCDPNLWWGDAYALVTRRDIAPGEELTNDYATSTGDPGFRMDCSCGSVHCREVVMGHDWRDPSLQRRYGRHWVPVLIARIEAASP